MLSKNTKAMVCLPNGDIDFFDIIAGVLQGDTLALYLFIFCLLFVFRALIDLIKENEFTLKRQETRYPTEKMTDVDDADNLVHLANSQVKA